MVQYVQMDACLFSSPNGMIFGKNATVNVETLLATNHGLMAKSTNTFELNNAGAGQIQR